MTPCSTHRKLIALLALDALDIQKAKDVRAHLETCEGCRRYLEEITNVTERLIAAETEPDIQPSESFHQRVVGRLRAEESGSFSETVVARLQAMLLNWRVVLPVIGATAAVFAAWSVFGPRPDIPLPAPTGAQAVLTPNLKHDLDPTISNYQMVANRSLEELDELLTRQGNRNPPPTPLYTASTLPGANASD
jgi:anti-sigma factor RsiW